MFNLKLFPLIMKEFFKALGKIHTYDIRRNGYVIFGILWGIPVPIVTIGMCLYYSNLAPSMNNIINEIVTSPIQLFFLLHPIIFGIVFGAMGTIRDEKEKQRLEFEKNIICKNKELAQANKKLHQLDEMKDNFLSMVSHELRTPLTTILGYVTFVKTGKAGTLSEGQKEALAIAEEQAEYLNNLIGELVDLSKIETGEFEVKLEPLNLNRLVDKVANSMKHSFDEKGIILENKLPEKLSFVLADQKRITQVLTNLLDNAIKFTHRGGRITITGQENGERIQLSVADTGIGIPSEKIDKIFDRFYQIDSTAQRKYGGCGLGLTIVKNIIELHKGGRIWVESKPAVGSKFFFELKTCKESLPVGRQGGKG